MEESQISGPILAFLRTEQCQTSTTLNHGKHCFLDSRFTAKSSWKPIPTNHKTEANHVPDSIKNKVTSIGDFGSLNFVHHASNDLETCKTKHSSNDLRGKGPGHQALMLQAQLTDAIVAYNGKRRVVSQDHLNAILMPRPTNRALSWRASPASVLLTPSYQHPLRLLHKTARQQRPFIRRASTVQPTPSPAPATPSDPPILSPPNHKPAQTPFPRPKTTRPTTLAQASTPHQTTPGRPPPDLATLKSDPKFKSLSRKWTSVMVALPIALYTTWVLLERCELPIPVPSSSPIIAGGSVP